MAQPDAVACHQSSDFRRGRRVLHINESRIETLAEPACEQRSTHFPRSNQEERATEGDGHACPSVSSMVAASASSDDLPAHTTNWKDW